MTLAVHEAERNRTMLETTPKMVESTLVMLRVDLVGSGSGRLELRDWGFG